MNIRAFDFSPLYRSTVGFDRLASTMNALSRAEAGATAYPPFNVEKTGNDAYRISLAVAGFGESDMDIETKEGRLTIAARRAENESKGGDREFLYRGIAERSFEKRFELDANVKVVSAALDRGLLHIDLVREIPEALKPRKISIGGAEKISA